VNVSEYILFAKPFLHENLRLSLTQAKDQVNGISKEQFLANSDELVINNIYSELEVIPLTIYQDHAALSDPQETRYQHQNRSGQTFYIDGVVTKLTIPYSGELSLWAYQPSTYSLNPPHGSVVPAREKQHVGYLEFTLVYSHAEFKDDAVNQETEDIITSLLENIAWVNRDVAEHNELLKAEILLQVRRRREHLGAIHTTLQKLNIPIIRREGAPDITELPIKRRVIEPLTSKTQTEPEYQILDAIYNEILKIIFHEGASFERTPATYTKLDEEELRNILLAHLNTTYLGQATGETFRKRGKTDICIEFQNRAAFVAECKLWKGGEAVLNAIDQLLGYITWRDVKTALILFNKAVAGFKQIQDELLGILRQHPNCIQAELLPSQSEWRLILRSKEDPDRQITIRVFLFNLYVS
jgi:hypothetical protein